MPPKGSKIKKSAALDAFMESEAGVKLFTALASCAEGIRGLTEFIHETLPAHLAANTPTPKDLTSGKKPAKDKDRIKRSPTAYILFLHDVRPLIVAENKDWQMKQVTIEGARRWTEATDEEREPYIAKAEILRRKYTQDQNALRAQKGLPPLATALAKRHAALDLEDKAAAQANGDDETTNDDDDEGEGEGEEEEEEEDEDEDEEEVVVAPVVAPKPVVPSPSKVKGAKVASSITKNHPKPDVASPAATKQTASASKAKSTGKATETPISTPSKAPNGSAKRKSDHAAASEPSDSVKKIKKVKKHALPSETALEGLPAKSPRADGAPPKKRGRPPKHPKPE
ncbi:hypothetical protein HKX48_006088 [Thoreauomyces humboldtii]|nr:hypothetical protein HKX48_006088 [Thoreauomyces humboldtii]